ncbi:MAG: RNA-binding protein [Calditrichaeota bacterium]|nr:MAG: RNA-binding protein [Calditrichota bacterium]
MNIFVRNISFQVSDDELRAAFEAYGEVDSAKIIKDRETGRSRGFGFVEMPQEEEARQAIENLNGSDINGREIFVSEARPREERPNRY